MQALLIDGHSLVKRCIMATALDDLKAGETFTGGVYGTLNILRAFLSHIDGYGIGPIWAFFDGGIPKFRRKLLPDYKESRAEKKQMLDEETKEKAFTQITLARDMLHMLGVRTVAFAFTEADDAVAGAVRVCMDLDVEPVVMSGDHDLWQTVQAGAKVWDLNKKRFVDHSNFEELAGVPASVYIVYRALTGDSSDGIKGCVGCGPKRAIALITEAMEHDDAFAKMPPKQQLVRLLAFVKSRTKARKYEANFVANYTYLHDVVEAIDLKESFAKAFSSGGPKLLRKWCLTGVPYVQYVEFVRFCKKLQFNRVLGDPHKFVAPFERCTRRAASSGIYQTA